MAYTTLLGCFLFALFHVTYSILQSEGSSQAFSKLERVFDNYGISLEQQAELILLESGKEKQREKPKGKYVRLVLAVRFLEMSKGQVSKNKFLEWHRANIRPSSVSELLQKSVQERAHDKTTFLLLEVVNSGTQEFRQRQGVSYNVKGLNDQSPLVAFKYDRYLPQIMGMKTQSSVQIVDRDFDPGLNNFGVCLDWPNQTEWRNHFREGVQCSSVLYVDHSFIIESFVKFFSPEEFESTPYYQSLTSEPPELLMFDYLNYTIIGYEHSSETLFLEFRWPNFKLAPTYLPVSRAVHRGQFNKEKSLFLYADFDDEAFVCDIDDVEDAPYPKCSPMLGMVECQFSNSLSKKTIICDKKEDAVDTRIDVLRSLSVNQIKALEVDKVKGFVHTRKMPSSVYYATNMPKLQIKGTVLDVSRSGLFSLHGPLPVGPVKRHKAKKLFMLPEDESLLVPGPLREFELEMDLVNGKAVWKLIRKAEHNSDPKTEL